MAFSGQAFQQSNASQLEKRMLFARIKKLDSLPLPSYILMELSAIVKNAPDNVDAIADCIGHDHVLLAQLLRLFYSSFPGVVPTNAHAAVEMLPMDSLKQLLYEPRMLDSFETVEETEWEHSYSCRILMESILADNGIENPQLILAAHLHDIGKNVFRDWSPKKYKIVENHAASSSQIPMYKLESAVLQTNHAEVGSELLKNWGFSEAVWKVVAQHHSDELPESYVFETALLQFVNYIDSKVRGIPCDPPSPKIMQAAQIAEIDENGYIGAQKQLIDHLKECNAGSIRKNMANEILASITDNAVASVAEETMADLQEADAAAEAAEAEAARPIEEEDEGNPDFDPEAYNASAVPSATAKREEELLRKMGLK